MFVEFGAVGILFLHGSLQMADTYDRAKASAARILAPRSSGGKGLELTLTKTTVGAYNPATGGSTNTTASYSGSGFRQEYKLKDVDGLLVKQGDVEILVSPLQISGTDMPAPATGDTITFDGAVYSVVSVSPWNFAGLAVGFVVQARR